MTPTHRDTKQRLKSLAFQRSDCALACTLDLIGDKWTLLVVRDLFFGKTRYKEFQASAENIPTNVLADRLKKLERFGMIEKTAYQNNPVRYAYRLTETGRSLAPVIQSIIAWAGEHIPGTRKPRAK
ncbi:MAG: helix-turn-helix transcriptional regulator [Gammaproteobacteria bacterium]|nr:helix-turn-helix transcriptional regulator [Gammaproteobacteria bacterium]